MKSNIISKINEWFAEQKFASDYTAATGEIVRVLTSLEVGGKVVQVLQGEEAPLTDGQYVLDNMKAIEVLGGEIKSINETTPIKETMGIETGALDNLGTEIDQYEEYKNEIDAKLEDGTEVKVLSKGDALSVGDKVLVKDAEGSFVKAPEGKHLLEGGLTIYTDAEGFINELETKETEEKEDETELKRQMGEMFAAIETLTSVVGELKNSISAVKTENEELTEKLNKFSAEPSAPSITEKKHFSKVGSKEEKLKFFSRR